MLNFFCHLTGYCYGAEVECPHCKKGWGVEWDTDDGQALPGDHDVRCPGCNKEFSFDVYLNAPTYKVR